LQVAHGEVLGVKGSVLYCGLWTEVHGELFFVQNWRPQRPFAGIWFLSQL
jgi:hypothetical protein